tara:strand:+ start:82488 stop:82631 length:144 start_codon:yes stop_codon:yes gene_type:complete
MWFDFTKQEQKMLQKVLRKEGVEETEKEKKNRLLKEIERLNKQVEEL